VIVLSEYPTCKCGHNILMHFKENGPCWAIKCNCKKFVAKQKKEKA
jgi:hypothetical protein